MGACTMSAVALHLPPHLTCSRRPQLRKGSKLEMHVQGRTISDALKSKL